VSPPRGLLFDSKSGTFLGQGRLSSNVVDSLLTRGPWTTAGAMPPLDVTNTMLINYILKHMHDKRTLQAQCQFMPRVYAAGTGFLLTRSCGCRFSTYPRPRVRVSEGSQKPYPYPYPLYPW
jgi:hypothetical protein